LEGSAGAWRWLARWFQQRHAALQGVQLNDGWACSLSRVGDVLVHAGSLQHHLVVTAGKWAALAWPLQPVDGAADVLRLDCTSAAPLEWLFLHAANAGDYALQPAQWRLGRDCGVRQGAASLQLLLQSTGRTAAALTLTPRQKSDHRRRGALRMTKGRASARHNLNE
jgi:hypothetical protein